MSDYRALLEGAVHAVFIASPTTFSWFGKRSPGLPPAIKRALTPNTARNFLLYNLQTCLYTDFYCRGSAAPAPEQIGGYSLGGSTPFVEQLSAANTGSGYWADGWEVISLDGDYVGLNKQGARVWAGPEDCAPGQGVALAPGVPVSVRFPKESLGVSPAYYMAMSDLWLRPEDSDGLVRFYWNIAAEGAARLMSALTSALNGGSVPFRFKVLSDPDRYERCDAGVLYVRRADYPAVSAFIASTYPEMAPYLKPRTPALTLALAPGLGLAEDPGQGQSFGQHRCRVIAEGLVRAYERKAQAPEQRLRTVLDCFEEHGISLDKPYLNPESDGEYGFSAPVFAPDSSGAQPTGEELPVVPPQALLDTALGIARQIAEQAVWYQDRCNWMGSDLLFNNKTHRYDMAYAALGPTLYTGTAGIALFLAELHVSSPNPDLLATALGAMRHALSRLEDVPTSVRPGLYSGWIGIALVAARVGALLDVDEFIERAATMMAELATQEPVSEADLLMGKAGALAACPILAAYLGDPSVIRYAARLAEELLEAADRDGSGYSWGSSVHKIGRNLTGFSHGSAGVGYALLELWSVTREPLLREAAAKAFEYERHWFDVEAGNWPDFRLDAGEKARKHTGRKKGRGENWPYASAWCNGAPGIALSRLRAFELLAGEECKAEALAGLRVAQRDVESNLTSPGAGFSLCHGLVGNSQVLLYGNDVLGSDWSSGPRLAAAVAAQGIKLYAGGARQWPCGVGRGQTPNLFLGLAGMGHFYLRLYNPAVPSVLLLRHEEWTTLVSSSRFPAEFAAV